MLKRFLRTTAYCRENNSRNCLSSVVVNPCSTYGAGHSVRLHYCSLHPCTEDTRHAVRQVLLVSVRSSAECRSIFFHDIRNYTQTIPPYTLHTVADNKDFSSKHQNTIFERESVRGKNPLFSTHDAHAGLPPMARIAYSSNHRFLTRTSAYTYYTC